MLSILSCGLNRELLELCIHINMRRISLVNTVGRSKYSPNILETGELKNLFLNNIRASILYLDRVHNLKLKL